MFQIKNVHKRVFATRLGYRPPAMSAVRALLVLSTFSAVLFLSGCSGKLNVKYKVIHHRRVDTNGLARGVAVQEFYAYVADGDSGLKIFNISNPNSVHQVGALELPGFNAQVAVEKDIALVTDTNQNSLYFVDISDKFKPALKWTYKTKDKVRALAVQGGTAFLAERGDDPLSPSYFSGLEAVSCSLSKSPSALKSLALKDVTDVAVTTGYVHVVGLQSLTILARTTSGFNPTPAGSQSFGSTEKIQSVDCRAESHLLILGLDLYLVDVTKPAQPLIVDKETVAGSDQYRVVSSAGVYPKPSQTGSSIQLVRFAYSTLKEYGYGMAELSSGQLMFVLLAKDIYNDSQGTVKLCHMELHPDYSLLYDSGDVFAVGALDNHGLGFAY